jgi:hypothetical protein
MLVNNRYYIIYAQALSQAIYIALRSLVGDTIPFRTALTLSLVAIVAIISQIQRCFLLGEL